MAVVQADRRETFYEAQRATGAGWRFSLLSVMAVLLLGLPVSVLISPFIAAVGLISVDVANEWTPMPDPVGSSVSCSSPPAAPARRPRSRSACRAPRCWRSGSACSSPAWWRWA